MRISIAPNETDLALSEQQLGGQLVYVSMLCIGPIPEDSERLCTQDFSGLPESHYPCQWMLIVQEPEGASGLWFQVKVWDTLHARMIPNLTTTSQAAS